jgi:hypothetical protein
MVGSAYGGASAGLDSFCLLFLIQEEKERILKFKV